MININNDNNTILINIAVTIEKEYWLAIIVKR